MTKEIKKKKKTGRKKIELNWAELDALCQFKVTKAFCADYLKVSEDTVENRIREKYDMTFKEYAALKISRTGFKLQQKAIEMALKGNTTMMIFSLKNLANWSDNIEAKIDGETAPVQINITKTAAKRTLKDIEDS